MSGTRSWYNYLSDNGVTYAVELDGDTGNLVALGFTAYAGTAATTPLPQGWEMRHINAVKMSGEGAGFISRRFPCGKPTAPVYAGTASVLTRDEVLYAVSSTRGEKQRRPKAGETGLALPD